MSAEVAAWIATGIEAAGIIAIVIGAIASTAMFLRRDGALEVGQPPGIRLRVAVDPPSAS